jgi:CBS domain-containing protein
MTPAAITIQPDATIPAAAKLMNQHHIRRRLPVARAVRSPLPPESGAGRG